MLLHLLVYAGAVVPLLVEGACDMVTTREVSVDDATTVTQMVGDLLTELEASDGQAELDAQLVAELLPMKERVHGFLAFAEERAVGLIMRTESASLFARGTYGIITELYVVPDQRSSGVAMGLIEAAVAVGTAKGWGQLEIGAPKQPVWSRSPNSALYLKAGFAEMGRGSSCRYTTQLARSPGLSLRRDRD
ncbi:GNAT family N-acetyltransferase [Bradyrhizobium sp. Arg816]|uniref:GNAT family N-acetyltransferase n=1 Tax=Bradyrhizobium sp. Arg816 TaxID=2998491 RepID=UPI00249F6EA1|nr:GNAT family N-acetyltransferase [Bradyrhizobium sp. Arg816]MDI3567389.1 GNAT family N-acetyltransferase [Bradyrhizobium sp. Arg816]